MVRSLGERVHMLRKIMKLKCGPGAAILPPEVTRIHMDFALKMDNGHMGSRKFMREQLPRLKYHNPSIPMIVNRHDTNSRSPTMTIYFSKPSTTVDAFTPVTQPTSSRSDLSKVQAPTENERVVTIDMKDKHSSHILDFFIAETRAKPVLPSEEDVAELKQLEATRKQADVDRERVKRDRAEVKKEQDMLKRAREAAGLSEADN